MVCILYVCCLLTAEDAEGAACVRQDSGQTTDGGQSILKALSSLGSKIDKLTKKLDEVDAKVISAV